MTSPRLVFEIYERRDLTLGVLVDPPVVNLPDRPCPSDMRRNSLATSRAFYDCRSRASDARIPAVLFESEVQA